MLDKQKMNRLLRYNQIIFFICLIIAGIVLFAGGVLLYDKCLKSILTEKNQFEFLSVLVVGPLVAYLWYMKSENAKNTIDDDRIHTSIEDLGSSSMTVRIGGIFILENMVHNNSLRSSNVIEILCTYLKCNQFKDQTKKELRYENKQCLDIISRLWGMYYRYWDYSINGEPDLRKINLSEYELWSVDLHGFFLERSNFSYCYLEKANLSGAKLSFSNFKGANLKDVNFKDATVYSSDFRNTKNLTQEQLNCASGCSGTKLPENLVKPETWRDECTLSTFCRYKSCDVLFSLKFETLDNLN